jgi:hypothetical protein
MFAMTWKNVIRSSSRPPKRLGCKIAVEATVHACAVGLIGQAAQRFTLRLPLAEDLAHPLRGMEDVGC